MWGGNYRESGLVHGRFAEHAGESDDCQLLDVSSPMR